MRRIDVRKGTENFKTLFPTEFELLTKNQQGGPFAPPSGRGLNSATPVLTLHPEYFYPKAGKAGQNR